ncbi:hypothetical protein IE81DRAFT_182889 [Ceraceosorus guamensis]|uniref:Secreted protein n=1 Tax=Ceraceosorus guamensis TaxID=1522189 RepID=A0A316VVE8_9BASI|nr:hypothetical protein IE81DRAFT_182889 [Ceraceosorus guamensis]PWN41264.1 hypothetical protein IE81DRAFT_182889 [Ceraceosorus guamensis]
MHAPRAACLTTSLLLLLYTDIHSLRPAPQPVKRPPHTESSALPAQRRPKRHAARSPTITQQLRNDRVGLAAKQQQKPVLGGLAGSDPECAPKHLISGFFPLHCDQVSYSCSGQDPRLDQAYVINKV